MLFIYKKFSSTVVRNKWLNLQSELVSVFIPRQAIQDTGTSKVLRQSLFDSGFLLVMHAWLHSWTRARQKLDFDRLFWTIDNTSVNGENRRGLLVACELSWFFPFVKVIHYIELNRVMSKKVSYFKENQAFFLHFWSSIDSIMHLTSREQARFARVV